MAHRRQSIKKIRVDQSRRLHNIRVKSELRTASKKLRALINDKKYEEALKESRVLFGKLDKAAKKGVLHSNTANRRKSRIALSINQIKSKA